MSCKVPKLIVFDLDYTLWPFYVDTHFSPPFKKNDKDNVVDRKGKLIPIYPDVPEIFDQLASKKIDLAVASRTSEINGANQLIDLFEWNYYFKYREIYPSSKVKHFKELAQKTGYSFDEMLFFDDEERNIREVGAMNVTCIFVENGMTLKELSRGLKQFEMSHSN